MTDRRMTVGDGDPNVDTGALVSMRSAMAKETHIYVIIPDTRLSASASTTRSNEPDVGDSQPSSGTSKSGRDE